MRLLFCGDIMGKSGRQIVQQCVPVLRQQLKLDFVVVNGENAAGGFGITRTIADELFAAGVDVITTGNHVWDQKELIHSINGEPRLLRPLNYPDGTPGQGVGQYRSTSGYRVVVVNVMGRLFMDALDDPFAALNRGLQPFHLGVNCDAVIVDIHAEASSEKQAVGTFLDGRASLVIGTHTHVPTADYRILPNGTAFQTDAGMCGDYDSLIGMRKEIALPRMVRKIPGPRNEAAEGPGTLCGLIVTTDPRTGLATVVQPVRIGGILDPVLPEA
jgi:2',3'-cyclic-nucleotide 2'-phosphodiesterase